jgi:hypothetical protein
MTLDEFLNAPYPARQDATATVWRADINRHVTLAVIQYAGEKTFCARAAYSDASTSQGITTDRHRTRRTATEEAIRLSRLLPPKDAIEPLHSTT